MKFPEVATGGALSDKGKYKKDSFTEKKRKVWNRGTLTQMRVTITEGLAATDKG